MYYYYYYYYWLVSQLINESITYILGKLVTN